MKKSKVQLSFQCPRQWNSLTLAEDGRFCSQCNKHVTDFSKLPLNEIDIKETGENGEQQCGSFHAWQLDQPFTDWRSKLVSFYQTKLLAPSLYTSWRKVNLAFLAIILLLTGCSRRVMGKMVRSEPKESVRHLSGTEQADVK